MDIHNLELEVSCYATAVYHEVNNRTLEEKLGVKVGVTVLVGVFVGVLVGV